MKKFNNKGFTLVEVLAVIAILAIIIVIAIPSINSSMERSVSKNDQAMGKAFKNGGELYVSKFESFIDASANNECFIDVNDLVGQGYLKDDDIEDDYKNGCLIYDGMNFSYFKSGIENDGGRIGCHGNFNRCYDRANSPTNNIVNKPTNSLCKSNVYNGSLQQLTTETSGVGYELSDYYGTNAGSYIVTAKLNDNYMWEDNSFDDVTFQCNIDKKSLIVSSVTSSKIYDGSSLTNNVCEAIGLIDGHTVTCTMASESTITNVGSVVNNIETVVVTDETNDVTNNYDIGVENGNLTISPKTLTSDMVTISPTSFKYDGIVKMPTVTVKDGGKILVKDKDYTVEYSNNNIGTGIVIVEGRGNYTGTVNKNFSIIYKNYDITLDNQGATSVGTSKLYGRYADGIYLDSSYGKKMTSSTNKITIPSKTSYYFLGYYDNNDVKMISELGYITSKLTSTTYDSNQVLYAKWIKKVYEILDSDGNHVTYAGSLKEAVTLVNNGETIKTLLANESEAVTIDKDITFDTNGKTISMTGPITVDSKVEINGNGTIALVGGQNSFEDESAVIFVSEKGNLNLSSGKIKSLRESRINSVIVDGGLFELSGGTIYSFDDGIVSNNGTVIISSGSISTNYDSIENNNGIVTITGGWLHSSYRTILNKGSSSKLVIGTNDGILDKESIELVVTGELNNDNINTGAVVESDTVWYFYDGVLESMIPISNLETVVVEDNYSVILENYYNDNNYFVYKYYLDNIYRVLDADGEVVGGTNTLDEAVSLASTDGTIVVLADNRTAGTIINKNLTLDTNGKKLTLTQNMVFTNAEFIIKGSGEIVLLPAVLFDVKSGATLSVEDGTIGFDGTEAGPVLVLQGGTFNFSGGILESINSVINAYSGIININGGTINAGSYGITHMQTSSIADRLIINITDGIISADLNAWASPIYIQKGSNEVEVNIFGGVLTGTGYGYLNEGTNTNCVITGGAITSISQPAIQSFVGTLTIGENDEIVNNDILSVTSANSYAINSSIVWEFYDGVLYSAKNPTYTGIGPSTLSEYAIEIIEETDKYKTYLTPVSTNADSINGLRSTNTLDGCDIYYVTTCTPGITGNCSYTIKNLFPSIGVLNRGLLDSELTNCMKTSVDDSYLFVEAGLTSSTASTSQIIGVLNKDSTIYITTEDVASTNANRKIMIPYENDVQMSGIINEFNSSGGAYVNNLTRFVTFNNKKYLYAWVNRTSVGIS